MWLVHRHNTNSCRDTIMQIVFTDVSSIAVCVFVDDSLEKRLRTCPNIAVVCWKSWIHES